MQAAALFKVMKETPPIPETLSSEGKDFLRCCFKRNPAERPTAAVLLEHRFLKNSQLLDVLSSTQLYNETSFMVNTTVVPLLYLSNHAIYLVLKFSFVCRTNHILQVGNLKIVMISCQPPVQRLQRVKLLRGEDFSFLRLIFSLHTWTNNVILFSVYLFGLPRSIACFLCAILFLC